MPSDEEIRSLCARVVKAQGKDFDTAIADLQSAIEARLAAGEDPDSGENE